MKILYIHQYYITDKQSGGTRSYEIINHLCNKGINVDLITGFPISNNNKIKNLNIYSTNTSYMNEMTYLRRILSFIQFIIKSIIIGLKIKNYDMVFATSTPLTVAVPAIVLSRIRKCPFIFEVRDVWPDIPIGLGIIKSPLLIFTSKLLEHIVYGKAEHIIALSIGMKRNILNKGVSQNKVSVITNMANIKLFQNAKNIREFIDSKYNTKNKFICFYAGTLGYANNVFYILETAKYLKNNKNIVFLIAGQGREKNKLINKKQQEHLDNVIFLSPLPKKEIVNYIKSADICISVFLNNPVLFDNSANKFFDYIAAGKCVLINYGGWQKELIEKEKFGFVCDGDNPEDMANKIQYAFENPGEIQLMGKRSFNIAKKYYSRDMNVKLVEKLIKHYSNRSKYDKINRIQS